MTVLGPRASDATVRKRNDAPILIKRAGSKLALPEWISQLARKLGLIDCKVVAKPVTVVSIRSQLNREGTIHPGFKTMLKQAMGGAGIKDTGEQESLAKDVISDLASVRTEVRRKLLEDLLSRMDRIGHDDPQQDGKFFAAINRIRRCASEAEARTPAHDLEGAFTVQAATDRINDFSLLVLNDYDDAVLAWAAQEELSTRTTPDKARNFLRIGANADLAGRGLEVLNGIRAVAGLPSGGPEIRDPSYFTCLRGLVRDDFTRLGIISPQRLELLFNEAAAYSGCTYSPESIQRAVDQLHALPAAVCDSLLNDLLHALGEEASGRASERLVDRVLGQIDEAANRPQTVATWKDLSRAQSPEEASFIIHDIARQGPSRHWSEEFRIWGSEHLHEAESSGEMSRQAASKFLELIAQFPLEERSAAVKKAIMAYASGDDVANWHRGLMRDYFVSFGTIPREAFELLFTEAAAHSGYTYSPASVDKAFEQLLAMPAKECADWLSALLNAVGEETEDRGSRGSVDGVLGRINKAASQPQTFAGWEDLWRAKTSEQACFIIHDIARHDRSTSRKAFRFQGLGSLQKAERLREISRGLASEFLGLANSVPLEGKSAEVRDIIRAYATGSDVAPADVSLPGSGQSPDRS